MSRFNIISTLIDGVTLIQRKPIKDERGSFSRFYCAREFIAAGVNKSIAQINHTFTRKKGAVRGLHFQYAPHTETKVVSCLKGEIFDVAVDIRQNSPTFLQWHGEVLSAENLKSLVVPEGFAHGFQALTDDCEIIYCVTAAYSAENESIINAIDPMIAISWPQPITERSNRDNTQPYIDEAFTGMSLPSPDEI